MEIHTTSKATIESAWRQISKYMGYLKSTLRYAETTVKEEVLGAYIR